MTIVDALVEDYLARLDRAAAHLPPDRRSDLLEGIGEHIDSARAAGAAADEAAVRTLLDRLGEPEEIVAAAQEELGPGSAAAPPVAAPPVAVRRGTGHEIGAVLMLTVGSFLPVIGWLVGVVLLWTSSLWRRREKLLGTLVLPFGPGAVLLLGPVFSLAVGGSPVDPPVHPPVDPTGGPTGDWLPLALTVLYLLAPVLVAVLLMRLARRRAAQAPPTMVPAYGVAPSPWGPLEISAVLLLGLGGFLVPVLGALVGLVLACVSRRWATRDKVVAALLALSPAVLVAVSLVLPAPGFSLVPGGWEVLLLLLVAWPVAAAYLAVVLSRRPAAIPRAPVGTPAP